MDKGAGDRGKIGRKGKGKREKRGRTEGTSRKRRVIEKKIRGKKKGRW